MDRAASRSPSRLPLKPEQEELDEELGVGRPRTFGVGLSPPTSDMLRSKGGGHQVAARRHQVAAGPLNSSNVVVCSQLQELSVTGPTAHRNAAAIVGSSCGLKEASSSSHPVLQRSADSTMQMQQRQVEEEAEEAAGDDWIMCEVSSVESSWSSCEDQDDMVDRMGQGDPRLIAIPGQ